MKFRKNIITLFIALANLIFLVNVKALESDASGNNGGNAGEGALNCHTTPAAWNDCQTPLYWISGIRVTVVDLYGNMVSERSVDYFSELSRNTLEQKQTRMKDLSISLFKCTNEKRNKLSYASGESCILTESELNTKEMIFLDWLPKLYFMGGNQTEKIRKKIADEMSVEELKSTFFERLGYDLDANIKNGNINNHYIIMEPITIIAGSKNGGNEPMYKSKKTYGNTYVNIYNFYYYYGTVTELSDIIIDKYPTIYGFVQSHFPFSMYVSGNSAIQGGGGFDATTKTYFKKIKTLGTPENSYNGYANYGNPWKLHESIADNHEQYGGGLGIFWIPELIPDEEIPDYDLDSCKLGIEQSHPTCSNNAYGYIKDIDDWNCIYASAYSSDANWNNYYLKYPSRQELPFSDCSVYCRDELVYRYPGNNMIALAGNYFTIATGTSNFNTYIDSNTNETKIKASTLGPVQVEIRRECSIKGNINNRACIDAVNNELENIKSPTIEFTYESDFYSNPTVELKTNDDKPIYTGLNGKYWRNVTYNYYLTNTYRYVDKKTGTSYTNTSLLGNKPYIKIENHLPIHFSKEPYRSDYQITVKKFNSKFDDIILGNKAMSTEITTSIEAYIDTLFDTGRISYKNINGVYYLDNLFLETLKNANYTVDDILNSACTDTDKLKCYSNQNGFYCYDKDKNGNITYSNSKSTYATFKACNKNAAKGNYTTKNYRNDMKYNCSFEVVPNGDPGKNIPDPEIKYLNIIFRTISLDNPFPSIDADGRDTGTNWCYGEDCTNINDTVKDVITNNRDVTTEEVYKELDPLYKITLTPALIKEIRKYNNKNKYDDFELECVDGYNCKSNFIRKNFKQYFSGCGIKNKSAGLTCQSNDKW